MMRRLLRFGVAAMAMLTILTACNSSAREAAQQHNQADVTFAQHMVSHHQQAIEVSDIVLAKQGIEPRVTELADTIKAAQGPEIAQMESWLSQWAVPTTPMAPGTTAGHDVSGMMSEQDMTR